MKRLTFSCLGLMLLCSLNLQAQQAPVAAIRATVEQPEVEMHIRFLASDELQGRDVGSQGLDVAARYLASYFRSWNLRPLTGLESYMQQVPFMQSIPAQQGQLSIGDRTIAFNNGFLLREGSNGTVQGPAVVLDYATEEELKSAQVKGKWVIARAGKGPDSSPQVQYMASFDKQKKLQEMGALGLIELYNNPQVSWEQISHYLTGSKLALATQNAAPKPAELPIVWVNDAQVKVMEGLKKKKQPQVSLNIKGKKEQQITSPNVLAVVEGTDPVLKQQYVLLSAHYDHVGIGAAVDGDSIYNGARDNAIGTTALMMAAQYFAKNPPKRSIIIAAWTAEEKGLLGSRWFVENAPIPLKNIVYNLNIDGAGYNDTTKVTVIGLERTQAEPALIAAAQAFGLEAIKDPVPEQNLFDRSDNVHFAKAGIPAPTYSQGVVAFDAELLKYYHQPADEADNLNFNYVTRYIQSFILAAEKIASSPTAPFWKEGDKYEAAGKKLYNK